MTKDIWSRTGFQFIESLDEYIETWRYEDSIVKYRVDKRSFISQWGESIHVVIKKDTLAFTGVPNRFTIEPTMKEKNDILNCVNANFYSEEACGFEIFPKHERIVDERDLFHIWMVKEDMIPFKPRVSPLIRIKKKIVIDGVSYYYFKVLRRYKKRWLWYYLLNRLDGEEIRWKEKQKFKDIVIGWDYNAVEMITDGNSSQAVLIRVPRRVGMPFGLRKSASRIAK